LEISPNIPAITAFSIDWESIIINFITNAIWAMEDTPAPDRKIRVRIYENNSWLQLCFADSGHGIADGTKDSIFLPTFSTKRNPNGDVIGTGMGLAIVQNFVDSYGGSVSVESPCDLGGAEFQIEVPV
jgi:signal transduction histidine kinase